MEEKNKNEPTGLDLRDFDWEQMIFDASVQVMQEDGHVVTDDEKNQLREMIRDQFTNRKT